MERIYRKGFGFRLISHRSFQTYRIINRSSSVSSVVSSAGFGLILKEIKTPSVCTGGAHDEVCLNLQWITQWVLWQSSEGYGSRFCTGRLGNLDDDPRDSLYSRC